MEEDVSLDEYVEIYLNGVEEVFPLLVKYLDYNMTVASYIIGMHINLLENDLISDDIKFDNKYDSSETIKLCIEILSSLSEDYKDLFISELNKGNIKLDSNLEFSSTSVSDGMVKIEIQQSNNILDVFKLVHEFLHLVHLKSCGNNLNSQNFFVFSEMIAMIGDFYTLFYLNSKDTYKEEVNKYLAEYFLGLTVKADKVASNGIFLYVQDKHKMLDLELVKKYVKDKNLPEEYTDLDSVLDQIDDFSYYEDATYIFGFIFSFLIAILITDNLEYRQKFVELLNKSGEIGTDKILKEFKLVDILKKEELLYNVINEFYDMLFYSLTKKEVSYQKKIGGLW